MQVSLEKKVALKREMIKHLRLLGKSHDPEIRILTAEEEIKQNRELEELEAPAVAQGG